MKPILIITLTLIASAGCLGQGTQPYHAALMPALALLPSSLAPPQSSPAKDQASEPGATIILELSKSLDAKKLKPGDSVEGRVASLSHMADGAIVPPGSKVMGHVTQASARAKGDPQSALGIVFDHISLKNGNDLPLKATIQAVGPPPAFGIAADNSSAMGGAGSNGPVGGTNPTGGVNLPATFPANSSAGPPPAPERGEQPNSPQLTSQSSGVIRLSDLQLEQGSVFASSGKDVKLASGSQILLRVQSQ